MEGISDKSVEQLKVEFYDNLKALELAQKAFEDTKIELSKKEA